MSDLLFDEIQKTAEYLKLNICAQEIAQLSINNNYSEEDMQAVCEFLKYLKSKRHENMAAMLLNHRHQRRRGRRHQGSSCGFSVLRSLRRRLRPYHRQCHNRNS